jgi:hypothetical protein
MYLKNIRTFLWHFWNKIDLFCVDETSRNNYTSSRCYHSPLSCCKDERQSEKLHYNVQFPQWCKYRAEVGYGYEPMTVPPQSSFTHTLRRSMISVHHSRQCHPGGSYLQLIILHFSAWMPSLHNPIMNKWVLNVMRVVVTLRISRAWPDMTQHNPSM